MELTAMLLDTRTIVLITGRLVDLCSMPRLFDDRMTPAIAARRMDRILDWLGSSGRIVASEYIRRREFPPPGDRKWRRGGYNHKIEE
jgi:hypothetical protein